MSTLLRSMKKRELKSKLNAWTPAAVRQHYGNHIESLLLESATEKYANGYLSFNKGSVEFVDITNGDCYKLRPLNENNNNCFNDLVLKSKELGTFRTEIINHAEVENGEEYVEVSAPNKEFGQHFVNTMMAGDEAASFAFAEEWIRVVADILEQMKEISAKRKTGIPKQLFSLNNAYKDSKGIFVTNIDTDWTTPVAQAIQFGIKTLETMQSKNEKSLNSLITLAKELWNE